MGVKIQVLKNGPLLVSEPIEIVNPDGQVVPVSAGQKIALCRCGHSQKKPLCDGSHKTANFQG